MTDRVGAFLRDAGLGALHKRFEDEDIDETLLKHLTDDDLRDLSLSLGQRKRFRAAIEAESARGPSTHSVVPSSIPAERRQLTVAFCDLVGSTQLATRLDPEDLRKVIATYLEISIGTMQAHGGHLAYSQGDGIMVYFGYPVAQEDDAERAVRAALATITAVQGIKTMVPEGINARIGIATGRVVVGDLVAESVTPQDFVVGETPNLASRLQGLAEPGEIMVSGETRVLAGGVFDYEPRGAVEFKGFADPRPVFRVISENAATSRFHARTADGVQPIMGRETELETLSLLWEEARAGQGRVGLIAGPAGIGKSRLIRSFVRIAGVQPVELHCAPHLANRALHPLILELEQAAGLMRGKRDEASHNKLEMLVSTSPRLTAEDLPLLSNFLRIETDEPVELDAARRARLTRDLLIRRMVGMTDAEGPVLVILEDAHWADAATQDFLDTLVGELVDLPLLLIITHRPEFETPPGYAALGARLDVAPLDEGAALALIGNISGNRKLPSMLVRQILEKTDGIPIFIEELTKSILDAVPAASAVTAETLDAITIPATLQDSLMSRLDRMGSAKEIAQLGAVIGRQFTEAMVAAVAPVDVDVSNALAQLAEAGILLRGGYKEPDSFVFNHALVQDTAYESLLRSRRQDLHFSLARQMLDGHPEFGVQEPEIIARHCEFGELYEDAVTHWIEAGRHAADRAANLPAITYLQSALRLLKALPEDRERDGTELGIQMALAPAYMAIYGWGAVEVERSSKRSQELAHALGDGQSLFGATWGLWTNYLLRGEMNDALATAKLLKAMAEAGPPGTLAVPVAHAMLYSHFFRGELAEGLAALEVGLEHFDLEVERQMLPVFQLSSGSALFSLGSSLLWLLGRDEEAYEMRRKAINISEALDHAPTLVQCLAVSSMFLVYGRDWPLLKESMIRANRVSEEEDFLYFKPMQEIYLGLEQGFNGEPEAGLERIFTLVEFVKGAGSPLTLAQSEIYAAEILVENGQPVEALKQMETLGSDAYRRGERLNWSEYYRVRGRAQLANGDAAEAQRDFELALAEAMQHGAIPFIQRAKASLAEIAETI